MGCQCVTGMQFISPISIVFVAIEPAVNQFPTSIGVADSSIPRHRQYESSGVAVDL